MCYSEEGHPHYTQHTLHIVQNSMTFRFRFTCLHFCTTQFQLYHFSSLSFFLLSIYWKIMKKKSNRNTSLLLHIGKTILFSNWIHFVASLTRERKLNGMKWNSKCKKISTEHERNFILILHLLLTNKLWASNVRMENCTTIEMHSSHLN